MNAWESLSQIIRFEFRTLELLSIIIFDADSDIMISVNHGGKKSGIQSDVMP